MGKNDGRVGRFRTGFVSSTLLLIASCSSSGGGDGDIQQGTNGPVPPSTITTNAAGGSVLVDWSLVDGATAYTVYWSFTPGIDVASDSSATVSMPPYTVDAGSASTLYLAISATDPDGEGAPSEIQTISIESGGGAPDQYLPSWGALAPLTTIGFSYDAGQSSAQNGAMLKAVMQSLQPGDRLEIGAGVYTMESYLDLSLQGTAQAPITIAAAAGAKPHITRPNANQNTMNVGASAPARYLTLQGLEITSGDIALRLYDCENVWVDQCDIHDCGQNAIAANSNPVSFLYFTRNQIHDTQGTGEGIYLGGNFSNPVAHDCVIALNHVYNTGGSQGDGIEVKQGSWGNWIAENLVHDTNYPCILVYGTDGNPVNLVERNTCFNSNDNVMQVQGEAIVRNNFLINGANGFYSHDHQGQTRDLTVVHNTIINIGPAARLNSWNDRPGMLFANNACYSLTDQSIWFPNGSTNVEVTGNVTVGPVSGTTSGYTLGAGLTDFVAVNWDATSLDITPTPGGALIGAGDTTHAVIDDLPGKIRESALETGAVDL